MWYDIWSGVYRKVSGMYRKYPSFNKTNYVYILPLLRSFSQSDSASIEIRVNWPLRCIWYTCTYLIFSLTCQLNRMFTCSTCTVRSLQCKIILTVKAIFQIVKFLIYFSLRLIFQSHPHFAKVVSFEGSTNKSPREHSIFPFSKLLNIWASCDEITFILFFSFNVWIVPTCGFQNTQRNWIFNQMTKLQTS